MRLCVVVVAVVVVVVVVVVVEGQVGNWGVAQSLFMSPLQWQTLQCSHFIFFRAPNSNHPGGSLKKK